MVKKAGKTILPTGKSPKFGFSLIELTLVILIFSLLVAWALPQLHRTYRYLVLQDAARQVYKIAQTVREKAVMSQSPVSIRFDYSKGTYGIHNMKEHKSGATERAWEPSDDLEGKIHRIPEEYQLLGEPAHWICLPDGNCDKAKWRVRGEEGVFEISVASGGSNITIREVSK